MKSTDEIVLGLRNDGCAPPTGKLTLSAAISDGKVSSVDLPAGEPAPGALKMYGLPGPAGADRFRWSG